MSSKGKYAFIGDAKTMTGAGNKVRADVCVEYYKTCEDDAMLGQEGMGRIPGRPPGNQECCKEESPAQYYGSATQYYNLVTRNYCSSASQNYELANTRPAWAFHKRLLQ